MGATHHARVFCAGNSTAAPLNLLVNAASEGAQAAFKIHSMLVNEDMGMEV